MTDPDSTTYVAALGIMFAGLIWVLQPERNVRTATVATTEVVLFGHWFDGFLCTVVIHVDYRQEHRLCQSGHYEESPRMTAARVVRARCLDWHDHFHHAKGRELEQIDESVRADPGRSGRSRGCWCWRWGSEND